MELVYLTKVMDALKTFHGMVWGEVDSEMDHVRAELMARGQSTQVDR